MQPRFSDDKFSKDGRYVVKLCFYERNGQYAGSQIYYDPDAASHACENWETTHGGVCEPVGPEDKCPGT